MTIGENVRSYRKRRKLKQHELAELSGVGKATIAQLEADQHWARFTTFAKISNALNASIDALVGRNKVFPRLRFGSDLSFGEKLAVARRANNLTRAALERKADIPKKTLERWENRGIDPTICYLIAVADVLNISLDELARGFGSGGR